MTSSNRGDRGRPPDGGLPDWMKPNDFGELTYLQMTGSDGYQLPKNPFVIGSSIEELVGPIEDASSESKGTYYTLQVRKQAQVSKLLKMTTLSDKTPVTVIPHPKLNRCRCVVSSFDLLELSENEIEEKLKQQGVIKVHRITRTVNGEKLGTSTLVLTFGKTTYPRFVKVGVLRVETRPYYPSPMLCYACLKYGHVSARCSGSRRCFNCSVPYHGTECNNEAKCANCEDKHRSSYRKCPVYQREIKVIRMKIDKNLTYPEARKRVEEGHGSYAQVTSQTRTMQIEINNLVEESKKKDEQIALLLENSKKQDQQIVQLIQLTKEKDERIAKLEATVQKMRSHIKQQQKQNPGTSVANKQGPNGSAGPSSSTALQELTTAPLRSKRSKNGSATLPSHETTDMQSDRLSPPPKKTFNTTIIPNTETDEMETEFIYDQEVEVIDDEDGISLN